MNIVGTSILVATLILGGTFSVANIQKVNAQMGNSNMTGGGGASGGMMGMMGMMGNQSNITGSVKLSTVMGNALVSQIKVSLSQACDDCRKYSREQFSCRSSTLWNCKWIFDIYCLGY